VSEVWKPVGPLPAAVYWRRRCVAVAAATALVALAVVAAAGVPVDQPVRTVNESTAAGVTPTWSVPTATAADEAPVDPGTAVIDGTAPGTATTTTSAHPTTTAGLPTTVDRTAAATRASDPFSAAALPETGTSTERIRPDDTPVAAQAIPVPASGPVPCTDAMLATAAELDHPVHKVGSRPVLRLVITDTGNQPCVRDLDAARQEIVVWSADGTQRIWSSNDCVNAHTADLRTLVPGRPVAFAVTWAERTTTPGCRTPRTPVPAGTYRLMTRLDGIISPPTPFIRTP
jgi:hypothetical protein